MITAKQLQGSYNKLYEQLRNYIWPYEAVKMIANLEVAIYSTFPIIQDIMTHFNRLSNFCHTYIKDDEDLNKSLANLSDIISESSSGIYCKLDSRVQGDN